jgi:RNA polymerase sigma factor (sigma-70 family)
MITASQSLSPVECLAAKHFEACQTCLHWTDVWQVFSDDPWFNRRLDDSAAYALKRCSLPFHNKDDVRQEALVYFARSIERDVSLGFKPERGTFSAFLATIINRCCQKGLRQFRNMHGYSITDESQHPLIEYRKQVDERLDFHELIGRIPEPYQGTIRLICDGLTIEEIAKRRRKSERTVYRWLEKGIEDLRVKLTG